MPIRLFFSSLINQMGWNRSILIYFNIIKKVMFQLLWDYFTFYLEDTIFTYNILKKSYEPIV